MRKLHRDKNTPRYVPDYMATSVTQIDFKKLKSQGVKYIAFDADSTLVQFRGKVLSDKSRKYLKQQRKLFKDWCIASNRISNNLLPLAKSIDAHIIQATLFNRKPQRQYFKQILKHFDAKPHEIAMIGDKLIADMYGAKKSGFVTVWVEHIGKDGLHDRIFKIRKIERRLMKKYMSEDA